MASECTRVENAISLPTIHVISDSVGLTAQAVTRAATSQFGVNDPCIEILPKVHTFNDIQRFFDEHRARHLEQQGAERMLVFYTLVDEALRVQLQTYVEEHPEIVAVDLLSAAISAIAEVSGLTPSTKPGGLHVADQNYFRRIAALEFTIAHDDGRNPQDLSQADLVLLGVSRTSKTPLSIYLAQQGLKVANVPLDLHTDPPKEIFDVDSTRLFGLMTTAEVLISIRQRRLGNASAVASSYADPEQVHQDLEQSRALMRKLGCIVVHTDNRAVEETAQEILRYYELAHPQLADPAGKPVQQ